MVSLPLRFTALLGIVALTACEVVSPRLVPVSLYLTDAPSQDIESARVWISSAYLVPAGEDGEFYTIFATAEGQEPQEYDLLTLQNGVTALLGTETIPEGEYAQLRLVVDQAEINLGGDATFADGSSSKMLFVPSGMETGIKVEFGGPITISGATSLTVDFDVEQNFTFLGPPGRPMDVLFTPLLVGSVTEG